jgi:hypothetical protein
VVPVEWDVVAVEWNVVAVEPKRVHFVQRVDEDEKAGIA